MIPLLNRIPNPNPNLQKLTPNVMTDGTPGVQIPVDLAVQLADVAGLDQIPRLDFIHDHDSRRRRAVPDDVDVVGEPRMDGVDAAVVNVRS